MKLVVGSETPYGRYVFKQALEATRQSSDPLERAQAACLAQVLGLRVSPLSIDETLATDVMAVIALRLADGEVVDFLLAVLQRRVQDLGKLTAGVERLAERAHRERRQEPLGHLVLAMLRTPQWRGRVRGDWASAALSSRDRSASRFSQEIIKTWLDVHGSVPDWMRTAVENDPHLLDWYLSDSERWQLHRAAPTTHGWRWIAGIPEQGQQLLEASAFGEQLDQAVETLQSAMADEPNAARRVVLARWLVEIAG